MKRTKEALGLHEGDAIEAAWAEHCSGPGWSNRIVRVLVAQRDGRYRTETLQPDDQTGEVITLFNLSALAMVEMTDAVRRSAR